MLLAEPYGWFTFGVIIVVALVLDLALFHRRARQVGLAEAVAWSVFWITLGLLFNLAIYYTRGRVDAMEFLTAYIMEKSLSVDNLFVICVIFQFFRVEPRYQHRVLFWGIVGAIVLRGVVIVGGVSLLRYVSWMDVVFGLFLVWTGIKMVKVEDDDPSIDPDRNLLVRAARRFFPVCSGFRGQAFFVRENAILHATPLLVVLLVVESADLLFAVDSIPAVLGISRSYFIVLTSNIFAILGLRALYFVLADIIDRFHYLKLGVCVILVFVGAKMIAEHLGVLHIPIEVSLAVILGVLTMASLASVVRERRLQATRELDAGEPQAEAT